MLCLLLTEQGPQNEVRDEDEGLIFAMYGAHGRKHDCTVHSWTCPRRQETRTDRLCEHGPTQPIFAGSAKSACTNRRANSRASRDGHDRDRPIASARCDRVAVGNDRKGPSMHTTSRRTIRMACCVAAVGALSVAACGGDDDDDWGAGWGSEPAAKPRRVAAVSSGTGKSLTPKPAATARGDMPSPAPSVSSKSVGASPGVRAASGTEEKDFFASFGVTA